MKFQISSKSLDQIQADALVIFSTQDKVSPQEKAIDKILGGQISRLRKLGDLTGEPNQTKILFFEKHLPRVLVVGLGQLPELNLEKLRTAISTAVTALKTLPVKKVAILSPRLPQNPVNQVCRALVETIGMSAYEFSYYKKPDEKKKADFENFELIFAKAHDRREAETGMRLGHVLFNAVVFARDLGNHPANVATPSHLAEHARRIAKEAKNIRVKILHKAEIKKEKMGGLLAVSQGSDEEPKFIILEYRSTKSAPTVVLVGKGVTFDSGGISIKPSDKMEEMKFDMMGGATVLATVKAASELRLPVNLVGLIPTTENLPSGKAIKPGDIITSRNGKTIEIVNTDAEGRLILADALDYAKKYKPALVMDFATLTGAIVVALGDDLIGAFTNKAALLPSLKTAAAVTGEKIWPMPLEKDYEQFIKSDFADLRNIGTTKYGDSINAANFLNNFVDYPWIHLDIAGVAWATREKLYRPKGATGTGVRLAIEFLRKYKRS